MTDAFHERIRKLAGKQFAGYIFITCSQPGDNGDMEVHFSHDGDPLLVSYLLEGANSSLEEECLET